MQKLPKFMHQWFKTVACSCTCALTWRYSIEHFVIGPFSFIEATINGNVYLDMCRNFVLDQRLQDQFFSNMGLHPIAMEHKKNSPQYMFRNISHSCHYRRYRTYRTIQKFCRKLKSTEGLLLMDIMPHGTTINSDAYVATLKKLQAPLSRVRRHREKLDVLLLHDNAQPYVSHKTTDQIRKFG
ncbi:hypothetical protein ANN_24452 [Periplaneta americana]|uniref:Mariner Mos1 transposase n=1 Tax=Periplaneta americana TaxID=6978 RepID=A0ABQ8S3T5_PERAM|nr:hypothetical protein ANN_24452 [Periplaneta americana]